MGQKAPIPLKTVLLVDDAQDCRLMARLFLSSFGYAVETARNATEALAQFDPKIHEVVVTDNSMPGLTGAELARIIKRWSPSTPVVMYSVTPPEDPSSLDLFIQRPTHSLVLKEGLDKLLAPHSASR